MEAYYSLNNNFPTSTGNCYSGFFDPLSRDLGPCNGSPRGGSLPVPVAQTLVLDTEKGELVKAPVRVGKKSVSEEKLVAALKSHSEAERRRRERINAHLDTLRSLLPTRDNKMDKATLLGEVIRQVKELKKNATEASKGLVVPMEDDEVTVEPLNDEEAANGAFCFKASVCCDYRPQLLTELRQALDALPIKMVKAEISTLGNRLKNDFVFTACTTTATRAHVDDAEARRFLASSIHQALSSVVEKASSSPEYSPNSPFPCKRRRMSYFDSSSSSS